MTPKEAQELILTKLKNSKEYQTKQRIFWAIVDENTKFVGLIETENINEAKRIAKKQNKSYSIYGEKIIGTWKKEEKFKK